MKIAPVLLLGILISTAASASPEATDTRTHFLCSFAEDQTRITADFTVLNIAEDPSLEGALEDDDYITSNRVTNSPILFEYELPNGKWQTPANPIYAISAGAFDESIDLDLITEGSNKFLSLTTADTDYCLGLKLELNAATDYQTGTYQMASCGDGAKKPVPVTCVVTPVSNR
jgi:hypothetical protein